MIAEKVRLRRSEVQNLSACPAWQSDNSEAARFGSLVHAVLAQWMRAMCATPDAHSLEVMDRACLFTLMEPAGVSADRFAELRELCRRFAETHDARPETLLYVEHELSWEGERVVLTGTSDRVDLLDAHTAMITDWKSAWAPSEASDAWQLRWYAALLFLTDSSLQTIVCRTDYLRLSEENGVTEWSETRDDTLAWWHGEVVPLAERIAERQRKYVSAADPSTVRGRERLPCGNGLGPTVPTALKATTASADMPSAPQDDLIPVGGAACQYCRHRLTCAESVAPYRNMPETAEQARALASDTVRLEAAAEERRAALRLWFREREPEVIAGEEWGFLAPRDQVLRILDTPGAVRVLEEHGTHDAEGMLVLDQRKLVARAKRVLLHAGVAELVDGEPNFRHRKATAR